MPSTANPDHVAPDSDLHAPSGDVGEQTPKKASREILRHEIEEGIDALDRPIKGLAVSGLAAGLDIGFSLFLMGVMLTHAEGLLPRPVEELLVAGAASIGFLFVILGRSELFTEQTTLAVLPVLNGRAKISGLLRLWGVVYVANLVGAAAFAGLATLVGSDMEIISERSFTQMARKLIDHPSHAMFLSGILAGWLMGLLSWLVAAGRDTISQIVLVTIVTSVIAFGNLHHCVLGTVEVLAGVMGGQGISMMDYGRFLLWATLGNIVGGVVFVAFLKYGQARPEAQSEPGTDQDR